MKFYGQLKEFLRGSHHRHRRPKQLKNEHTPHADAVTTLETTAEVDVVRISFQGYWKDAYEKLQSEDQKLAESYRKILLQQIAQRDESPSGTNNDLLLERFITTRLEEIERAQVRVEISGREIVAREQVRRIMNVIVSVKDFISTAVSSEPHAALAWAGILVLMNPVIRSTAQGDDAIDCFEKISKLMVVYRVVESTPIDSSSRAGSNQAEPLSDLASEIQTQMITLYSHILKYQARLSKHLSKSGFLRFVEDLAATDDWKGMFQEIDSVDQSIRKSLDTLNTHTLQQVNMQVLELQEQIAISTKAMVDAGDNAKEAKEAQLLSKLHVPKGAAVDYDDDTSDCLEGTQVNTLEQIQNWLESPNSESMFWLSGMAGTGKSTISRTVAKACHLNRSMVNRTPLQRSNMVLGASFLFDKNDDDRKTTKHFFTTLCQGLVEHLPDIKSDVCDVISAHPNIGSESISKQWKRLILDPLVLLDKRNAVVPLTLVMVIDALDECVSEEDIDTIIQLFNQADVLDNLSLRLFITSRPEIHIQSSFDGISREQSAAFQKHELQKVKISNSEDDDITKFLRHNIPPIAQKHRLGKDWPGEERTKKLAEKSDGLFIYAATACRFLDGLRLSKTEVDRRLQIIFEDQYGKLTPLNSLDRIYTQILQISVIGHTLDEEKEERCRLFQKVVGALITLFKPLCIKEIANLLSEDISDVESTFQRIHSAISCGEDRASPVHLLHLSFRDFLLDEKRCMEGEFLISQKDVHDSLLTNCLDTLSSTLKQNICALSEGSTLAVNVEPAQLEQHLPRHVQYACLHWIGHLQESARNPLDGDEVFIFLTTHLLHWLEALCLMGKLSEGASYALSLAKYLNDLPPGGRQELQLLTYDMGRFMLRFRSMFEETPLQIYQSALVHCPGSSHIRRYFSRFIPTSIIRPPVVRENWEACQQTFQVDGFKSICFSPDGKLLASANVHIWEAATGSLLKSLDTLGEGRLVDFSLDGKHVICLMADGTVNIWNVATGIMVKRIQSSLSESPSPPKADFGLISYDKSLAVIGHRGGKVQILDLESGATQTSIEVDAEYDAGVKLLILSHDATILAISFLDGKVQLWDTLTGVMKHSFDYPTPWYFNRPGYNTPTQSGHFSPDCTKFGFTCCDGIVYVWDTATGLLLKKVNHDCLQLIFLSNSRFLMADPREIRISNIESGQIVERLPISFGDHISLRLSPSGNLLASVPQRVFWSSGLSGFAPHIQVCDITTGKLLTTLYGHTDAVNDVVFSPYGMLASAASDDTIRLWNLTRGSDLERPREKKVDSRIKGPLSTPCYGGIVVVEFSNHHFALLDIKTGTVRKTFSIHKGWPLSPGAQFFFGDAGHGEYQVCSTETSEMVGKIQLLDRERDLEYFALSVDGQLFATNLGVWDVSTGENLFNFPHDSWDPQPQPDWSTNPDNGTWLAFSPDCGLLAMCFPGTANTINLGVWNVSTGTLLTMRSIAKFSRFSVAECFVMFAPDGESLAFKLEGHTLQLWDLRNDQVTSLCDFDDVGDVAFSSDGTKLAFWTRYHKLIGLRDLNTGTTITEHMGNVLTARKYLRFMQDNVTLDTAFGRIDTRSFFHRESLTIDRSLFVKNDWVIQGSHAVFRFPAGDPVVRAVAFEDTLIVDYTSGRSDFLEFDSKSPL